MIHNWKNLAGLLGLLGILLIASCGPSVSITGSWANPELVGKKKFKKVFIFAITSNMGARQTIETDLQNAATKEGVETIRSIDVLNPGFLASKPGKDEVMQRIKANGCDAIFTATLVDSKSETRYVPGTTYAPYSYGYYGSFGGYYGYHGAYMYDPGYYVNEQTYFIESNLYDMSNEALVWSVQSEAYNPSSLSSFSRDYTMTLFAQLKKDFVTGK